MISEPLVPRPRPSTSRLLHLAPPGEVDALDHPALDRVATWVRDYLDAPHPDLGRTGSVCPFVGAALQRAGIALALEPGSPSVEHGMALMRHYREQFAALAEEADKDRIFVAVLVVFPDLPAVRFGEFVEGVQAALKPEFMADGLMIGEFHPGPPDRPGLWNPDFRPFDAPEPILAIRHMVSADVPFVTDTAEHADLYLERFGDVVPRRLAPLLAPLLAPQHAPTGVAAAAPAGEAR